MAGRAGPLLWAASTDSAPLADDDLVNDDSYFYLYLLPLPLPLPCLYLYLYLYPFTQTDASGVTQCIAMNTRPWFDLV